MVTDMISARDYTPKSHGKTKTSRYYFKLYSEKQVYIYIMMKPILLGTRLSCPFVVTSKANILDVVTTVNIMLQSQLLFGQR